MPLKKTVAAERRMDLASFFCMIGRHGPAVALAVVAVVTVLAGFYIYRTVTGRRRKAACADGALSPGEEGGEASVIQQSRRRAGESTDLSGDGVTDAMEDVGNLRRRPAAAEKNPPTFAPKIHTAGMKPTAQTEEASGGVEVKSLEPGNQEEHEEVLGDERPEGGDVSTGSRTGTEENRRCSTDTGDVPASLICPSKGQQMEKASPEEGEEPCDKTFWSTDLPSEAGASAPDSRDDGDVSAEVMREDAGGSRAGCDVDDEEAELRSAEVSDAGSSPPWQRRDKTSQCVDEVSESSVNGLERPSPETGNPPEPHGATSSETSHLPPTRELGSAPDAAASATFPDPGVAPGPPVGDLQLSSFEPTQKKDEGNASSAGAGAESGISSLAVSPDAEADGNIFSPEPVLAGDPQAISLYADDAALSAAIERMTGETLGPLQPCCSQMSHSTSWTAANEDAFGHEIEDGYHRLVEQFAAQIAVSVTSLTGQLTDVRAALEVVETRAKEKEDSQAEADCERSEISIMEATMETNEWITDTASPLPPWLLPAPVDHPNTRPPPSDRRSAATPPRPTFLPGRSSLTKTWNISKRWWRSSPCLRTSTSPSASIITPRRRTRRWQSPATSRSWGAGRSSSPWRR
ncbi:uncharacterized protein LOC130517317 [Takifugu flavidus]|uniref:uncharacterized protein LOC130517317 n=1 Tax=Takifugu flavidus TaxID=433684 RepID=UPI002544299A|nr:uncharacterized protein LOC130517317 [Takifugu flavidus]